MALLDIRSLPTAEESELSRESSRAISAFLQTGVKSQLIEIKDKDGISHPIQIPISALKLLVTILTEVGDGNTVNIVPVHAELTSQKAADLLNVSRPFVIQLLEKGKIPFRKVGTHRRVQFKDVIEYKRKIDAKRQESLDELTAQAQELDIRSDELKLYRYL